MGGGEGEIDEMYRSSPRTEVLILEKSHFNELKTRCQQSQIMNVREHNP